MTSTTFFIIFIPILAILLLAINLLLAPHNPYQEKDSVFECGFHSFLGQNRTQFSVSFYVVAILFLIFDVELTVSYPYAVSVYNNDSYGLVIMMLFFLLLTLGFVFELGKNALTIDSRQTSSYNNVDTTVSHAFFNSAKAELVTTNVLTSSYEVRESTILMMVVLPIVALVINPDVYSEVVYFTQHLAGIFYTSDILVGFFSVSFSLHARGNPNVPTVVEGEAGVYIDVKGETGDPSVDECPDTATKQHRLCQQTPEEFENTSTAIQSAECSRCEKSMEYAKDVVDACISCGREFCNSCSNLLMSGESSNSIIPLVVLGEFPALMVFSTICKMLSNKDIRFYLAYRLEVFYKKVRVALVHLFEKALLFGVLLSIVAILLVLL